MITAKVIADSKNEFGNRITTMIVTMPRYILAEFNTHRMLSKNSASSRAIPFDKMLKSVESNPFIPIAWMKDHKGMQGTEYLTDEPAIRFAESSWKVSLEDALINAENLSKAAGVTKQLANRLLEPFMWHTVIVTATEWENFFALRCPQYIYEERVNGKVAKTTYYRSRKDWKAYQEVKSYAPETETYFSIPQTEIEWLRTNKGQADIHMMATAEAMWDAYNESKPVELKASEWHIPFGDDVPIQECHRLFVEGKGGDADWNITRVKVATARCARVSYTVVGQDQLKVEDLAVGMAIEVKEGFLDGTVKTKEDFNKAKWIVRSFEEGDRAYIERALTGQNAKNGLCGVRAVPSAPNYDSDIKLHDRLAASGHWSPFEHCAKAMNGDIDPIKWHLGWSGNFRGFIQYRKMFNNENIK